MNTLAFFPEPEVRKHELDELALLVGFRTLEYEPRPSAFI